MDIRKSYRSGTVPVPALRGVSLDVAAGSLTAVMGPSGCGKSTLLTVAGGLRAADSGTVVVAGVDLASLSDSASHRHRRRHIGFVFQDYNIVPTLNTIENVMLPLELDGRKRSHARTEAERALAAVGIDDLAARHPDALSGGQRQRVALARAICGERGLILADEPTGALDSAAAGQVLDTLVGLVRDGAACLVVTHDEAVAARADRVVRMRDGLVIDDGREGSSS
ncbi:ABC transporter ATP-binding protein [Actinoalloteichus sp. AHMU CJ021]|uniref:ABC transporter ATP-binding protein n=1 Tax=Actinoalloteichus sp. AHMU CJ021 TaxID=2072503 RepID=UPI00307BE53D